MSIILRPGKINVRQGTSGNYVSLSGVTDATIAEVRAALRTETDAALEEAIAEGRTEMAELVDEYTQQITASQNVTWTTLTPGTGTTTPGEGNYGNGVLKIGKLGNIVYIRGGCNTSGGKIIATIPSGYRPSTGNVYKLAACKDKRIARIYVNQSGEFRCEWIIGIDNASETHSTVWVDCNLTYAI